jgi:hypothetical protein
MTDLWLNNEGSRSGAARRSRTPNLQIRSLSLYPVELWLHVPLPARPPCGRRIVG